MRRAKGGYLKKEYINTRISGIKSFCIDTGQCVGYYRHTFPGKSISGNLALIRVSDRIGRKSRLIDKWCLLDAFMNRKLIRKELQ